MNVLVHWSDERVAAVAKRLGTPTPARRDDVRRVLSEAEAIPADLYRRTVEALEEIRRVVAIEDSDDVDPRHQYQQVKRVQEIVATALGGRYADSRTPPSSCASLGTEPNIGEER